MPIADLHCHSTASDGTLSPEALVRAQVAAGVRWVSLTDHDTTAGVPEAIETGRFLGVEVIAGVEISTRFAGEDVHILAYGVEPGDPDFEGMLRENRAARLVRMREILERMKGHGVDVPLDEVMAAAGGASVGRPHLAKVLLDRGVIEDIEDAFRLYVGLGAPCYVPRADIWAADAVRRIRAAGGRAVLAHPGTLRDPAFILEALLPAGLWGLEARHGSHDESMRLRYEGIAAALRLAVTGGTDYHGPQSIRDVPLGSIAVPESTLAVLVDGRWAPA